MRSRFLMLSIALGLLFSAGLLVVLRAPATTTAAQMAFDLAEDDAATTLSAQQAISTAYVIVRFGRHDALVRSITFTQPISVYHALELSGLAFTIKDFGFDFFMCSIEEVGDSSSVCDNGDRYWSTSTWNATAERWDARGSGVATTMITEDGHVEGFSWSDPGWTAVDPPPAPSLAAAAKALAWLETRQQADGSFGVPGNTAEVLMALGANRMNGADWRQDDGPSVLAAMLRQSRQLAATAAGAGKLALALTPQETCWPFGALQPLDYYSATTGAFNADAAPHALAMLGTAALSQTVPASATAYLLDLQQANGGWEWGNGWGADTNTTALALQALIAAGESPTATAIISGLTYLKQAQNNDGGFPYDPDSQWGTASDTNSTAYVVQALLAVGEDPLSSEWSIGGASGTMIIDGANPVAFLLGMQLPDGSFEWQKGLGTNQMATQQAVTALLYRPLPIRTAALAPCEVFITYLPFVARD